MHHYAGLDIGTTHTKLVICDPSLKILHQSRRPYVKGFGAELDAPEILSNVMELLEEASAFHSTSGNTFTVSFSAAMHSLLLVNEAAIPLTPVYTWADTSSQPTAERLKNDPAIRALFRETGTPFHPMSPFCKLLWLRESNPSLLDSAYKCIGIKEYIWFQLTGNWEIDESLAAATGLFSQTKRDWHPRVLGLLGIRPLQLSKPVPITHSHYRDNIRWVIGGSDGAMAQIGSSALERGTAALTIGTSGAIRTCIPHLWTDERQELFTYMVDETTFLCGGAINNGGIVLQWWQQQVMQVKGDPIAAMAAFVVEAATAPAGSDGLVCLPYFGGERSPVWDATASGVFAGVRLSHTQAFFKRAILEGIGFSFRQLLEKLENAHGKIERIYASGGFTESKWWVQLLATILQRPLLVPEEPADASAMGAIAVAMKAEGKLENWFGFGDIVPVALLQYNPDVQTRSTYDNNFQHYLRLCHS